MEVRPTPAQRATHCENLRGSVTKITDQCPKKGGRSWMDQGGRDLLMGEAHFLAKARSSRALRICFMMEASFSPCDEIHSTSLGEIMDSVAVFSVP